MKKYDRRDDVNKLITKELKDRKYKRLKRLAASNSE